MNFIEIVIVNDKPIWQVVVVEKGYLINVKYSYREYLDIVITLHFLSTMTWKLTWMGLSKQLELKLGLKAFKNVIN